MNECEVKGFDSICGGDLVEWENVLRSFVIFKGLCYVFIEIYDFSAFCRTHSQSELIEFESTQHEN